MKISAQEEYGLRCLIQVARIGEGGSISIAEICRREGLSSANVAKFMRVLRTGGFVRSIRGQEGGYALARAASEVTVAEVLACLGGRFYDESFCDEHAGIDPCCTHLSRCSVRGLWERLQTIVDDALRKVTLADLLKKEEQELIRLR
jgi:Rrf2 family protein